MYIIYIMKISFFSRSSLIFEISSKFKTFVTFRTIFTSVIYLFDDFFYPVIFCILQKKRFLALESSFSRFRQLKKNSSPNLQNFGQLLEVIFWSDDFFDHFFAPYKKAFIGSRISFLRFRQNKKKSPNLQNFAQLLLFDLMTFFNPVIFWRTF